MICRSPSLQVKKKERRFETTFSVLLLWNRHYRMDSWTCKNNNSYKYHNLSTMWIVQHCVRFCFLYHGVDYFKRHTQCSITTETWSKMHSTRKNHYRLLFFFQHFMNPLFDKSVAVATAVLPSSSCLNGITVHFDWLTEPFSQFVTDNDNLSGEACESAVILFLSWPSCYMM